MTQYIRLYLVNLIEICWIAIAPPSPTLAAKGRAASHARLRAPAPVSSARWRRTSSENVHASAWSRTKPVAQVAIANIAALSTLSARYSNMPHGCYRLKHSLQICVMV
jgi:hypothetical protein